MRGAVAAVVLALLVVAMQQVLFTFGVWFWLIVLFSWFSGGFVVLVAYDIHRRSW